MKLIETNTVISAPAEVIWNVLMDFEAYPDWNPFIKVIEGKPLVGERLRIIIEPPTKKPMTFKPIVKTALQNQQFEWRGGLLIPGVFDGFHCFHLESIADDKTQFKQFEQFSGILIPFVFGSIRDAVTAGFQSMNDALKHRAESYYKQGI